MSLLNLSSFLSDDFSVASFVIVLSATAHATSVFYSHLSTFPPVSVVPQPSCELGSIPSQHNMQSSMQVRQAPEPQRVSSARSHDTQAAPGSPSVTRSSTIPSPFAVNSKTSPSSGPPPARPAIASGPPPPAPKRMRKVRVLYTFTPEPDDNEGLSCNQGDVLTVKEQRGPDWLLCSDSRAREGYVPVNYTEPC